MTKTNELLQKIDAKATAHMEQMVRDCEQRVIQGEKKIRAMEEKFAELQCKNAELQAHVPKSQRRVTIAPEAFTNSTSMSSGNKYVPPNVVTTQPMIAVTSS